MHVRPVAMLKCHCRDCQRVTGGPYAAVVVPASTFRLTRGQLRHHFTAKLAGGRHKRAVCADLGSRISGGASDGDAHIMGILAGSLDEPGWFQPTMDVLSSDAQPWDRLDSKSPKHEQYSPAS